MLLHCQTFLQDVQHIESKIEKVPRGIRGEKSSKDMASSRNLVSTTGAQASPTLQVYEWGGVRASKISCNILRFDLRIFW